MVRLVQGDQGGSGRLGPIRVARVGSGQLGAVQGGLSRFRGSSGRFSSIMRVILEIKMKRGFSAG